MSGERLFELLGGLDLELVDAASETPAARKRGSLALIAPIAAACVVLALLSPAFIPAKKAMDAEVNGNDYNQSTAPEEASGGGSQDPGVEGGNMFDNEAPGSADANETQNGGTDLNGGMWIDGVVTEAGESIVVTSDSGERYVLTMSERAPVPERMPELETGDAVRVVYGGKLIWTDSGTAEVPVVFGIYTRAFPFRDLRAEDVASVTAGDRVLTDEDMARAIELLRGLVTVGDSSFTGWREYGWETVTFTLSLKDGGTLTVELAGRELLILDGEAWDMDHWLPEVSELWELATDTARE